MSLRFFVYIVSRHRSPNILQLNLRSFPVLYPPGAPVRSAGAQWALILAGPGPRTSHSASVRRTHRVISSKRAALAITGNSRTWTPRGGIQFYAALVPPTRPQSGRLHRFYFTQQLAVDSIFAL